MELVEKIKKKEALLGVVGLGYVGLPLVKEFLAAGFRVLGFDTDKGKVETLNAGESYILMLPPELVKAWRRRDRFVATTDAARLCEPDVLLICVPTPLNKTREPELCYVRQTAGDIGRALRRGQLVVLESTTYPGTTAEVMQPCLESLSGLKVGDDFYVAYSPEREDPGNQNFGLGTTPKVIGADDEDSLSAALALYGQIVPHTIEVTSTRAAEAVKLLENIFRAVNIALVNELKMIFDRMGLDVWEIIEAAKSKPFGFMPFYPGPGLGGHCIPIDPFYLAWKAREYGMSTRFIELAGEINISMPRYVLSRLREALNDKGQPVKGSNILVLGIAYKPDVDDARESPALGIIELLLNDGAQVDYHDPYLPHMHGFRSHDLHLDSVPLTPETLAGADCVLIVTNHSCIDYQMVLDHASLIVDSRNACAGLTGEARVVKA